MDLRHARTFIAVVDHGTVSKAAQTLRIAQPALSRQIAELEQELGFALFDRLGRRLVLTSAGEQLADEYRGLLSHAAGVAERAQLLRRGDFGVLRVAASPQHIESVLSRFLHVYARAFPNVQVKIVEAAGRESLQLLERGEVHLVQNLLNALPPDDPRFSTRTLESVELLAAYHAPIALARKGPVEIAELADRPLLLLDSGFTIRRTFDAACRLAELEPNILLESRSPHTLLAMAETGHGVAIIPSQFRTDRYALRIVSLRFRGRSLREPLAMLWDKRRPLPSYAQAFCEMLGRHMREVFPITRPGDSTGPSGRRRS